MKETKDLTKREYAVAWEATRQAGNCILSYPANRIPRDMIEAWFKERLAHLQRLEKKAKK